MLPFQPRVVRHYSLSRGFLGTGPGRFRCPPGTKPARVTRKVELRLPGTGYSNTREHGHLNHLGDKVDPDQLAVNKELSLCRVIRPLWGSRMRKGPLVPRRARFDY